MPGKLEVSFNSPQCGWMSIGFDDGVNEFHTTTAHAPHELALPELLQILSALKDSEAQHNEFILKWNRDPEEFDFVFVREGESLLLEIYQYPTDERETAERELVFVHRGTVDDVCESFAATFEQLYADRNTDEFEFNWRQPFPYKEFEEFKGRMGHG
ncbi:MAG: hypothetical protein ABI791_12625 [Acidobacteriota bacterium]